MNNSEPSDSQRGLIPPLRWCDLLGATRLCVLFFANSANLRGRCALYGSNHLISSFSSAVAMCIVIA